MYIASYEMAGENWLQGAVAFPFACASDKSDELAWSKTLNGILHGLAGKPKLRPSFRFNLNNGDIQRTVFLTAPLSEESDLRKSLACFLRLNLRLDNSARLPSKRVDHDSLVTRFPRYQCMLALPSYRADEVWLACDFNVRTLLHRLASEAAALGYSFAYHVNFEPFSASPALVRQASRNLLALREKQGAPQGLLRLQERILGHFNSARFLSEEILGADGPDVTDWLGSVLRAHFDTCYRSTHLAPPEFRFEQNAFEDSLSATRHRVAFQTLNADEILSSCVETEEVQNVLGWCPPAELVARWKQVATMSVAAPAELAAIVPPDLPVPYDGSEDYIFISYKRQDMGRIAPVLRQIAARGKRFWYDKGIPGGAEWNALIEERVEHCRLLILFVSTAAVQSRYVRREAQFADTLKKPILGIRLEKAVLSDGMNMLLNQYQSIDATSAEFSQELERAMRYARIL